MDFRELLEALSVERVATLSIYGLPVSLQVFGEDFSTLVMVATLYKGEAGYLPPSVRRCAASGRTVPSRLLDSILSIDEATAAVQLQCTAPFEEATFTEFSELINEFIWLAQEWRLMLDEHGERDLVHIYIKK